MTDPLPLHHPFVIHGARAVQAWRESAFPAGSLYAVCIAVNVRHWLLATGWEGTDGSSCSFDSIRGVRIGRTGGQFNCLPATLHDVAYELLRRFTTPARVRAEADAMYRDECIAKLRNKLVPGSLSCLVGTAQAWGRWTVLRAVGWVGAR